jgi:hypothetical protein
MITKEQKEAAFKCVLALTESIKELGSVPSGHLYAQIMDRCSLSQYTQLIKMVIGTGLVTKDNNLLTWIG